MHTPISQKIFDASVRQDKKPPGRLTAGSSMPVTANSLDQNRQKHHGSETRKTIQTSGRVLPHIKAAILQKAKVNGWTESKALAVLVEIGLEHDLGEQYWVRISAKIEDAVYKAVEKHSRRESRLNRQGFLASEQGRIIGIQILRYILTLGKGEIGDLPHIIEDSQKLAWNNLKYNLGEDQKRQS